MTNTTTTKFSPADLSKGLTRAKAAYSAAEDADHSRLVTCAEFTFHVHSLGLIGKDAPEQGWTSMRDYAANFVGRSGTPASHTTAIMWRRAGRALSLGITPEDPKTADTFRRIVQWFGDARITEALDTGSKTAITKAVKAISLPDGKRVPAKKAATATGAEKAAKGTESDSVPMGRNTSTTLDSVETLIARLGKVSKAERVRLVEIVERIAVVYGDRADFLAQVSDVLTAPAADADAA